MAGMQGDGMLKSFLDAKNVQMTVTRKHTSQSNYNSKEEFAQSLVKSDIKR